MLISRICALANAWKKVLRSVSTRARSLSSTVSDKRSRAELNMRRAKVTLAFLAENKTLLTCIFFGAGEQIRGIRDAHTGVVYIQLEKGSDSGRPRVGICGMQPSIAALLMIVAMEMMGVHDAFRKKFGLVHVIV